MNMLFFQGRSRERVKGVPRDVKTRPEAIEERSRQVTQSHQEGRNENSQREA